MPRAIFFDLGNTLVITSEKRWVPEAPQVLATLASRGFYIGLISNTADLNREQLLLHLPADFVFELFNPELIILSSEVEVAKPNPDIFRLAIQKAALPANQCVFCGENLAETWVAQQVGMLSFRLLPPPNSDLKYLPNFLWANQ